MSEFKRRLIFEVEDRDFQRHRRDVKEYSNETTHAADQAGNAFERVGAKAKLWIAGVAVAAFTTLVATVNKARRVATEFSTAMAEWATLGDTTADALGRMRREVVDIAARMGGGSISEYAKALYDIRSAGFEGAEGLRVLEASAKTAVAGVTDVATAADLVTTVLNAYSLGADKATQVTDTLFATVRAGKTTIPELASSIGRVAPMAAAANVELDELGAGVAMLTGSGLSTAEAMTRLNGIIRTFIRPTETAKRAAEELGVGLDAATIQSRGLVGAVLDIIDATGGGAEGLSNMFTDTEALSGALILARNSGKDFEQQVDSLRSSSDATESAFRRMRDETSNLSERLRNQLDAALINIGERTLPTVNRALQTMLSLLQRITETDDESLLRVLRGTGADPATIAEIETRVNRAALERQREQLERQLAGSRFGGFQARLTTMSDEDLTLVRQRIADQLRSIAESTEIQDLKDQIARIEAHPGGTAIYERQWRAMREELASLERSSASAVQQLEVQSRILDNVTQLRSSLAAVTTELARIDEQAQSLNLPEHFSTDAIDAYVESLEKAVFGPPDLPRSKVVTEEDLRRFMQAREALAAIRRAVELSTAASNDHRRALQDVFDLQDQLGRLARTMPDLSGRELAAAREIEQTLKKQLEDAQNRVRVEEEAANAIDRAAEAANRLTRMKPAELFVFPEGFANMSQQRIAAAQRAVSEYEKEVTKLNNRLSAGKVTQEEYASAMAAANTKALGAVRELYSWLDKSGLLTDELEASLREWFTSIESGAVKATEKTERLSDTLQSVGTSIRSMSRLLDVFGDLRRETRLLMEGLADVADNAGRFIGIWNRLEKSRGSAGGILELAIPGIGMVAGIASSIAGLIGSNKEQQQEMSRLRESLEQNARDVSRAIDRFVNAARQGEGVTGEQAQQVRGARSIFTQAMNDAASRFPRDIPSDGMADPEGPGTGEERQARMRAAFERLLDDLVGVGIKELDGVDLWRLWGDALMKYGDAETAIEAVMSGSMDGMARGLDRLLANIANVGAIGLNVEGAVSSLDLFQRYLGKTMPEAFGKFVDFMLENVEGLSDEMQALLSEARGLNPTSREDEIRLRELATRMVQALIDSDTDFMGGLTRVEIEKLADAVIGLARWRPDEEPGTTPEVSSAAGALGRLRTRQALTGMSQQELYTHFLDDVARLDLGELIGGLLDETFGAFDMDDTASKQQMLAVVSMLGERLADGLLPLGDLTGAEMEAILQVLRNFAEGIEDVTEGLGFSVAGAVEGLNILVRFMRVEAADALGEFIKMLEQATDDVPDEARKLVDEAGALDITSAEGRRRLEEIVAAIGALILSTEDQDQKQAMQAIASGFQQILGMPQPAGEDNTRRSVQQIRTVTDFTGNEMVLLLAAIEHFEREQLVQQRIIAANTAHLAGIASAIDAATAGIRQAALTPVTAAGAQILNNITVPIGGIHLTRPFSETEDVDIITDAIATEIRRQLTQAF